MAHSTLHFTVGMVVGTGFAAPRLVRAFLRKVAWHDGFRHWFAWSFAAGVFAVIPGILRRFGVSDALCDNPWMNMFLLYPWINSVKPGAETMGPLVLGAFLGFQYLVLVGILVWKLRASQPQEEQTV